jgi:hypothetical protein
MVAAGRPRAYFREEQISNRVPPTGHAKFPAVSLLAAKFPARGKKIPCGPTKNSLLAAKSSLRVRQKFPAAARKFLT